MSSVFTKIVKGEIPAHKIAETADFLAFLDVSPLTEGHLLVIPKKEIDYIFDIEDELLANMMVFAKTIAKGLKNAIPCKRIGIAVVGLEVPHAHIHLIPMNNVSDMDFSKAKLKQTTEELANTALKIKNALKNNQ